MNVVLIGAGQRGMIYAELMKNQHGCEISAIVEPNDTRRAYAAEQLGTDKTRCFRSEDELWSLGKIADAAIIASMDRQHYAQAMRCLEIGYHILLEKPISPEPGECADIARLASQKGLAVVVCHVLRYTPFFSKIKEIIDSGTLGRVLAVRLDENIGNFHFAHSFVRGNWRRADLASPVILQKSCHDMDLLNWLVGGRATRLSSFGALQYFDKAHAPAAAASRCCDCPIENDCRFSAYKAYLPTLGDWPAAVVSLETDEKKFREILKESPYGRCVYHCDNDVCDTQVVSMQYDSGAVISFTMSSMTNRMCRTIKVMCEHGEICGDDGLRHIEVTRFAPNQVCGYESRVIHTPETMSGHGGGDGAIVEDFLGLLNGGGESRSSIAVSVDSHIMAAAAERSRLCGESIDMDAYRAQLGL